MTRFALASVLALGALSFTTHATAQDDREAARANFERGVGLYESGDYRGALESFQEAYRLAPHPSVRVNMANCYEHLGRPIEAIHHFDRFLAEAENPSRQQRREVQGAMRRLRALVGEVRFAIAPDGAMVTIDGSETRRAPVLDPILMSRGSHTVAVSLEGYVSVRETINIEGGETQRVSIRLDRVGSGRPPVASTDPETGDPVQDTGDPVQDTDDTTSESDPVAFATGIEPSDDSPSDASGGGGFELRITTPVIIAGAATGAFLLGAIITGVVALSFNDQFEDAVIRRNAARTPAERSQARADGFAAADTAKALSVVTDVFIIGTIAAAGLTGFFVIIEGMNGDDSMAGGDEGVRLVAVPSVATDGGGLVLIGSF